MDEYFDDLEHRDPGLRERELMATLPKQIANAKQNAAGFARIFAAIDPAAIDSREALAQLPVTRKSDLVELQKGERPFGGLNAIAPGKLGRIYSSPGPIYDPEGRRADYWRLARALFAAGFRAGDLVHNTFAYHFTPAGFMCDLGAQALGCAVIPAGTGQTELQVAAIRDLRPQAYVGTPSFLKIILEKGDELGADLTSLRKACVAGEAFLSAQRSDFERRGISTVQCYASADLGLIAYESRAREGMIIDEEVIIEIVRPGSGEPVSEGDTGEVVVTTLTPEYPLIRFATGDLSAVLPGPSPCGRTNMRIKGWLGRADQAAKVRGMFVHPTQVADVMRRHPEISAVRAVLEHDGQGNDVMTLYCEGNASDALKQRVSASVREVCKLRAEIAFKPRGSLPGDAKLIEDKRSFD